MGNNAGDDLSLKVTAAVDQNEFAKISRQVKTLTKDIEELAKALNAAGGLLGGTKLGTLNTSKGPGTSASHQITNQLGGSGGGAGGLAGNVTKSVTNIATLFKGAGNQSKEAFKTMNDALKDHVDRSEREIRRLGSALEGLEKRRAQIIQRQQAVGGGGGPEHGTVLGEINDDYIQTTAKMHAARSHHAAIIKQQQILNMPSQPAFAFGGGNADGTFTPEGAPGGGGGGGRGGGMITALAARMGIRIPGWAGPVAGPLAVVAAGLKGGYMGGALSTEADQANINLGLESPMFALRRTGIFGQTMGGLAQQLHGGNVMRGIATQLAMRSKGVLGADFNSFVRQDLENRIPVGAMESMLKGTDMWSAIKDKGNAGLDVIANAISGGDGKNLPKGLQEIKRRMESEYLSTKGAQRLEDATNEIMKINPLFNDRVNNTYGNALGNLAKARAGGYSGNLVYKKNDQGVMERYEQIKLLDAEMEANRYDPSERYSMNQRMQAAAGRGNMHKSLFGMLSMTAGGFTNAPEMYGIGAQYGAGDAFMTALQKLTGRGGLDPTAASSLFGFGGNAMTSGNFQGNTGAGFMASLAEAASFGYAGGDLRGARTAAAGFGGLGEVLGGRLDPLQQALNFSAAVNAAPNSDPFTKMALAEMDPATMLDVSRSIAEGKGLPRSLTSMGVTADMFEGTLKGIESTMFSRVASNFGPNTAAGQEVAKAKAFGGLGYLKGDADMGGKLEDLSLALQRVNGWDAEKAQGYVRLWAARDGLLPGLNGKGAARSDSSKSVAAAAARARGEISKDDAAALGREAENDGTGAPNYRDAMEGLPAWLRTTDANRAATQQAAKGSFGGLDGAIEQINAAFQNFVSQLKAVGGSGLNNNKPIKTGTVKGSGKK